MDPVASTSKLLPMPALEAGSDDLIHQATTHVNSRRRNQLTKRIPRQRKDTMEVLSESMYANRHHGRDTDEVDDSFFMLEDGPNAGRDKVGPGLVKLTIGQVRGTTGKTIRRLRRKREPRSRPQSSLGEDEDEAVITEDDEPLTRTTTRELDGLDGAMLADSYVMYESPAGSVESLGSSISGVMESAESPSLASGAMQGFNTMPTLSEHPLAPELSPSESDAKSPRLTEHLFEVPSHTLTLDEGRPTQSRRSSNRGNKFKQGTRLSQLRPKDLSRVLASRRHRLGRGQRPDEANDAALEAALAAAAVEVEEIKTELDVMYEHQRGLVVFGLPQFSGAALTQLDPAAWTDSHLQNSAFTRHDCPLPSPFWHWIDPEWMVDMGGDTDEHGWQYAVRFGSRFWRGQPDTWRSFVRRRRWIRARVFLPHVPPALSSAADQGISHVDWHAMQRMNGETDNADAENGISGDGNASDGNAFTPGMSLKTATALLPLSPARKDEIFGWEMALEPRKPFLPWKYVKTEGERTLQRRRVSGETRSDDKLLGIWRDAVIEINYRRIARVVKECRLDREKLALWRWWLHVPKQQIVQEEEDSFEKEDGRPSVEDDARAPNARSRFDARQWGDKDPRPELDDVWDLLEARLDPILQLFEFQLSRFHLLNLVLSLHPVAHAHHNFKSYDAPDGPFVPQELSPENVGSRFKRRFVFYEDVKALMIVYRGEMGWPPVDEQSLPEVIGRKVDEMSRRTTDGRVKSKQNMGHSRKNSVTPGVKDI